MPIMLRSRYCTLYENSDKDLTELGECPYDQGGYFIINGSEKVLIAQEKMSTNHVYVFKKRQPNKYAYVAEVRSMAESQNRPASSMFVRMLSRAGAKGVRYIPFLMLTVPEWTRKCGNMSKNVMIMMLQKESCLQFYVPSRLTCSQPTKNYAEFKSILTTLTYW